YGYDTRQQDHTINPKTRFENDSIVSLEDVVKDVISSRLPSDMAHIYGLTVKTRVITTRFGSLTVFFGVLLSGFTFIANYKSFFDSVQLIRAHLTLLLSGRLQEKLGENLDITVSVEQPKLDDPRESRLPSEFRHFFKHMQFEPEFVEAFSLMAYQRQNRRDAFFWFLFVFCIILIGIISVLVFIAVKKTYFP
ncbi:hypothetical protein LLG96_20025, partial [bacterium]|nr:hypothetical protein [bacterium]